MTIAALADYRMALLLVDDHHLTLDELEDWIADITAHAVARVTTARAKGDDDVGTDREP